MTNDRIVALLRQVHAGEPIDGRSAGSLKRMKYLLADGTLSTMGYYEIDEYECCPSIPAIDLTIYDDSLLASISERVYNNRCGCAGCSDMVDHDVYIVSVAKLMAEYAQYVIDVNRTLKKSYWDHSLDIAVRNGIAPPNATSHMLRLAHQEVRLGNYSYTQTIMLLLAQSIAAGLPTSNVDSGFKYSICDNSDEINHLLVAGTSEHKIIHTMTSNII